MSKIINDISKEYLNKDIPDFKPGDTLNVHIRVIEGQKERIQQFKGVVIARKNGGIHETFTIRKISYGIGVEKIFPLHSPKIAKIELVKKGRVKRAKLYYLRGKVGKGTKIKELDLRKSLSDESTEE